MLLEVPIFNIESALIVQQAGAHRIELCASMSDGGITPSHGMILWAKQKLHIPFFVMIRPRGGNFTYSDEELRAMLLDIDFCHRQGVEGIVTGVLTQHGTVDMQACKALKEAAKNMQLTFHRAFDRTADPFEAMEQIIECGFHRILTSGHKETAPEGAALITELNKRAAGRIIIMPGSGVNEKNLQQLHEQCNCTEYHSSAKVKIQNSFSNPLPSDSEETWTVSEEKIRKMVEIMKFIKIQMKNEMNK